MNALSLKTGIKSNQSVLSATNAKQKNYVSKRSTPLYAAIDNGLPACFSLFYRGRKAAKHGFKPIPSGLFNVSTTPQWRRILDSNQW